MVADLAAARDDAKDYRMERRAAAGPALRDTAALREHADGAISPARPRAFQWAKSDAENFSFTEMLSCVSVKT